MGSFQEIRYVRLEPLQVSRRPWWSYYPFETNRVPTLCSSAAELGVAVWHTKTKRAELQYVLEIQRKILTPGITARTRT